MTMRVHVSIHDVSPATQPLVEQAVAACAARGIQPALLVVPDFHRQAPLLSNPAYCARLRQLQEKGSEVFLHGFFHQSRPRPPEGVGRLRWLLAQKVVSAGEAEFADVTPAEAEERLTKGEAVLQEAGLRVDGFVPPAWSMEPWLVPMLARRGYRYCEDHLHIYDPVAGASRASVVLNYASRSQARLWSTVAYCRVARHAAALFPARVALHPADLQSPILRFELGGLLDWAIGHQVSAPALFES
jgi:predicted deacetylase